MLVCAKNYYAILYSLKYYCTLGFETIVIRRSFFSDILQDFTGDLMSKNEGSL